MHKLIGLVIGLSLLLETLPASANFMTEFSFSGATISYDHTTSTVNTSGGASTSGSTTIFGADFVAINNLLTVSPTGTTGGFTLGAFADSNSPAGGCCTFPTLEFDGFSIHNQSGSTRTLTITIGDTGFMLPGGQFPTLTSNFYAVPGNTNVGTTTVSFTSFFDATDTQFGTGQSLFSGSMNLFLGEQTSLNTASIMVGTGPFSLTNVFAITLANGDIVHMLTSTTVTNVPEPSTWLLLCAGLSGLLLCRTRLTNRS